MKKIVILMLVLVACCCLSSLIAGFLFGNFEANGQCIYKGPMANVTSGTCLSATSESSSNSTTTSASDTKSYIGATYSLTYPTKFSVDDSDSKRLFVYADNVADNLNISKQVMKLDVNQTNCESYAADSISQLTDYSVELGTVTTTKIGGFNACSINFTADYSTKYGRINQTQYYIEVGGQAYYVTITINENSSNFALLDKVARSMTFN